MKKLFFLFIILLPLLSCNDKIINPNDTSNDYLPLKERNYWIYDINYTPIAFGLEYYHKIVGTLKWTITKINKEDTVQIYSVEEVFNGFETHGDNFKDTTFITDRIDNFELIEYTNGFVEFTPNGILKRWIKIKRFYEFSSSSIPDSIILDGLYTYPYTEDENLIRLDGERYRIKLIKGLGIKKWDIETTHNSGPIGTLSLIDFNINE